MKKGKTMKPLPSYGNHMTMEEFTRLSEGRGNGFLDYDGFAHYATETEMLSDPYIDVLPSMVLNGTINKEWTHVVWFNR